MTLMELQFWGDRTINKQMLHLGAVVSFALFTSVVIVNYSLTALAYLLLIALAIISIYRPIIILYLSMLLAPIRGILVEVVPQQIFLGKTILPTDLLFVMLIAGLMLSLIRSRRLSFKNVDKSTIYFTIVVICGFIYGLMMGHEEVFSSSRGLLFYVALPLLIMYGKKRNTPSMRHYIFFMICLLVTINVMIILISLGYFKVLHGSKYISHYYGFYRPNKLIDTVYAIPSIYIGLFLYQYDSRFRSKVLAVLCMFVGSATVMVTITRSFVISMIITLFIYPIILRKVKLNSKRMVVSIVLLIVAIAGVSFVSDNKFLKVYTERFRNEESVDYRINEARDYFISIRKRPLWGHGLGAPVNRIYSSGYINGVDEDETSYSHNEYLYILQTVGIIGFLVFVYFIYNNIIDLVKLIRCVRNKYDKIICHLVLSLLITLTIISISSPEFRSVTISPFLVSALFVFRNLQNRIQV